MMDAGFSNVYCFDAGIMEWTSAYPELSSLLGKTPVDKSKLITEANFKLRLLGKEVFFKEVDRKNAFLIDTRDPLQRIKNPKFSKNAANISFDRLVKLLKNENFKKKIQGKTLLMFDAVGKQVRWLQYHLQDNGIKNYYFLKGGVWSFFGSEGANK